ncbi:hypothetical protein [Bythopirellula polymerisocia]|uniref:Uncharacterized protein n=1 Tax=Bythopirellula polymerisocia TaxID=2528003 RepID=A0A5C6D245_9BACT|nr:hypothetical protein [Bythopirellula polymerisocia]TWU29727.1 hypothetical protein Pla144_05060 [Bythopirellula polymerisocia]
MASPPPMVALDALDEQRQGLRVEFHWRDDRYFHTIYRVTCDTAVPVVTSLEGAEDELFPASPCLFELHQQEQVLFLTGATSVCHWSLSVQSMSANRLVFEVACRLKAKPPWLGSKYEVMHDSAQEMLHTLSGKAMLNDSEQICIASAAEVPLEFPTTLQWKYAARV